LEAIHLTLPVEAENLLSNESKGGTAVGKVTAEASIED
jgi:hypothetical protein